MYTSRHRCRRCVFKMLPGRIWQTITHSHGTGRVPSDEETAKTKHDVERQVWVDFVNWKMQQRNLFCRCLPKEAKESAEEGEKRVSLRFHITLSRRRWRQRANYAGEFRESAAVLIFEFNGFSQIKVILNEFPNFKCRWRSFQCDENMNDGERKMFKFNHCNNNVTLSTFHNLR
jgi:hypothetical protein